MDAGYSDEPPAQSAEEAFRRAQQETFDYHLTRNFLETDTVDPEGRSAYELAKERADEAVRRHNELLASESQSDAHNDSNVSAPDRVATPVPDRASIPGTVDPELVEAAPGNGLPAPDGRLGRAVGRAADNLRHPSRVADVLTNGAVTRHRERTAAAAEAQREADVRRTALLQGDEAARQRLEASPEGRQAQAQLQAARQQEASRTQIERAGVLLTPAEIARRERRERRATERAARQRAARGADGDLNPTTNVLLGPDAGVGTGSAPTGPEAPAETPEARRVRLTRESAASLDRQWRRPAGRPGEFGPRAGEPYEQLPSLRARNVGAAAGAGGNGPGGRGPGGPGDHGPHGGPNGHEDNHDPHGADAHGEHGEHHGPHFLPEHPLEPARLALEEARAEVGRLEAEYARQRAIDASVLVPRELIAAREAEVEADRGLRIQTALHDLGELVAKPLESDKDVRSVELRDTDKALMADDLAVMFQMQRVWHEELNQDSGAAGRPEGFFRDRRRQKSNERPESLWLAREVWQGFDPDGRPVLLELAYVRDAQHVQDGASGDVVKARHAGFRLQTVHILDAGMQPFVVKNGRPQTDSRKNLVPSSGLQKRLNRQRMSMPDFNADGPAVPPRDIEKGLQEHGFFIEPKPPQPRPGELAPADVREQGRGAVPAELAAAGVSVTPREGETPQEALARVQREMADARDAFLAMSDVQQPPVLAPVPNAAPISAPDTAPPAPPIAPSAPPAGGAAPLPPPSSPYAQPPRGPRFVEVVPAAPPPIVPGSAPRRPEAQAGGMPPPGPPRPPLGPPAPPQGPDLSRLAPPPEGSRVEGPPPPGDQPPVPPGGGGNEAAQPRPEQPAVEGWRPKSKYPYAEMLSGVDVLYPDADEKLSEQLARGVLTTNAGQENSRVLAKLMKEQGNEAVLSEARSMVSAAEDILRQGPPRADAAGEFTLVELGNRNLLHSPSWALRGMVEQERLADKSAAKQPAQEESVRPFGPDADTVRDHIIYDQVGAQLEKAFADGGLETEGMTDKYKQSIEKILADSDLRDAKTGKLTPEGRLKLGEAWDQVNVDAKRYGKLLDTMEDMADGERLGELSVDAYNDVVEAALKSGMVRIPKELGPKEVAYRTTSRGVERSSVHIISPTDEVKYDTRINDRLGLEPVPGNEYAEKFLEDADVVMNKLSQRGTDTVLPNSKRREILVSQLKAERAVLDEKLKSQPLRGGPKSPVRGAVSAPAEYSVAREGWDRGASEERFTNFSQIVHRVQETNKDWGVARAGQLPRPQVEKLLEAARDVDEVEAIEQEYIRRAKDEAGTQIVRTEIIGGGIQRQLDAALGAPGSAGTLVRPSADRDPSRNEVFAVNSRVLEMIEKRRAKLRDEFLLQRAEQARIAREQAEAQAEADRVAAEQAEAAKAAKEAKKKGGGKKGGVARTAPEAAPAEPESTAPATAGAREAKRAARATGSRTTSSRTPRTSSGRGARTTSAGAQRGAARGGGGEARSATAGGARGPEATAPALETINRSANLTEAIEQIRRITDVDQLERELANFRERAVEQGLVEGDPAVFERVSPKPDESGAILPDAADAARFIVEEAARFEALVQAKRDEVAASAADLDLSALQGDPAERSPRRGGGSRGGRRPSGGSGRSQKKR